MVMLLSGGYLAKQLIVFGGIIRKREGRRDKLVSIAQEKQR